jgi:dTDP-4-dehydrorhamnose reductase
MRVLVTGVNGQVARALGERAASAGHEVQTLGRPQLDLSGEADRIVSAIESAAPEAIVSAAAYTAVDQAEQEPELAFAVNATGAGAVARAAARLNVPLVHLSTDYVFDGEKAAPYAETDQTNPMGVYGASKLAGERNVLSEQPNSAILRTAWVYSPFGRNFVKTMLRLSEERDEVAVVADQIGNPTSALDIASGLFAVISNLVASDDPARRGIFHMTASGEASWAEFAAAVFRASQPLGGPAANVRRIATADYPTPAKRPANSRLDTSRVAAVHNVRLPDWQSSLETVVRRLIRGDQFKALGTEG